MPNLGDFSIGRWSLLSYRFWLVILGLVLILFGFLFYRAYQVGPLLRPPPAPSSSVSSSAPEGNWPTGRADLGASGSTRENGPAPPWSVVWDFQAPGKILGTPAAVGNRVYITTEAGIALALDKDTSEVLWTFVFGSPADSAPAVTESAVYFGSRNHRVLAVHKDTGQLLWEHNLGNIVLGSPIVVDGTLYIGSTNGKLVALDAVTAEARWSVGADGWVVGHPAADGRVVAAASLGERFITVDPESGRRLLKFFTGTPVAGGPVIANGLAYFVTNQGGVWAVDPYAVSRPFSRLAYVANVNFFAWRLRDDAPIQVGTVWGVTRGAAWPTVLLSPTAIWWWLTKPVT